MFGHGCGNHACTSMHEVPALMSARTNVHDFTGLALSNCGWIGKAPGVVSTLLSLGSPCKWPLLTSGETPPEGGLPIASERELPFGCPLVAAGSNEALMSENCSITRLDV